jgi:hypothetical protein
MGDNLEAKAKPVSQAANHQAQLDGRIDCLFFF